MLPLDGAMLVPLATRLDSELVELRETAQPALALDGRIARDGGAARDVADDAALRGDARAVADRDVIGDADLTAHHHAASDDHRAGEAALRRDEGALADLAVVTDVDLRVDLRALLDPRGRQRAGRNRAECTDMNVVLDDDAAEVRDRAHRAVRAASRSRSRRRR